MPGQALMQRGQVVQSNTKVFLAGSARRHKNYWVFKPNCTFPSVGTNLVLGVDVRSTLGILWSSIFTLLICCWTVLHLNIPRQEPVPPTRTWRYIRWGIKRFLPKLQWMIVTLIMPELLVGKALQDRHLAKSSITDFDSLINGLDYRFKWSITHGFYADMGGFVLKARSHADHRSVEPSPVVLNLRSLKYVIKETDLIENLPKITEAEIQDKSKGDLFVKGIAIIQLTWFGLQIIARWIRVLAVSQLEIAVLAYAACSFITFCLNLSKPKDVQVPTIVPVKTEQSLERKHWREIEWGRPQSWFRISLRSSYFSSSPTNRASVLHPMPNDARYSHNAAASMIFPTDACLTRMDDGFIIVGIIFGGIHCAAWTADFPTPVERLLWQISSVITAGVLPLYYGCFLVDVHLQRVPVLRNVLPVLELVFGLSYILARLYLLVEVFRSLGFLPPSAYVGTWSAEIPHLD